MKRFRLLKQTRQTTEYSCGACALQSVMSYWGKDIDEAELMKLLGTSPEAGTWPEDLVRVAREQGLDAELRSELTIEDIERATSAGQPVIVLGQVWRSAQAGDTPVADEWDCGHWFIAIDVDQDYVYFQDPYVRMGKGFVPRKTFEDAWHNVMGGDEQFAALGGLVNLRHLNLQHNPFTGSGLAAWKELDRLEVLPERHACERRKPAASHPINRDWSACIWVTMVWGTRA